MQPHNQLSSLLNEPIKEHRFTHSQGQREKKDGTMSSSVAHLTMKSFWIQFNNNANILVFSYGICATVHVTIPGWSIIHYIKSNKSEGQTNIDRSEYETLKMNLILVNFSLWKMNLILTQKKKKKKMKEQ